MNKKNTLSPSHLFALLIILTAGCGDEGAQTSGGPPSDGKSTLAKITVAKPVIHPIVEWDEYTGRLSAIDYVEVRARVNGYLQSVHFDEGQMVNVGDLLYVIDPKPFEAELISAEARVVEAEAKLAEADALLHQANAQKSENEAQLKLRIAQFDRLKTLKQSNAISQDELDIGRSEWVQSRSALESANSQIESAKAAIATANAAIATAQSKAEAAKLNLSYTRVSAPIAGRISRRLVTQGNLVNGGTAGSTMLTTIVSLDPIHCYFDANEQEFLKYARLDRAGKRTSSREAKNPVYLRLIDEKDFPHLGHMDFVDNRMDPNTGTMRGRAIFANPEGTLTPGLFAEVRLPGSGRYEATLIPDSAIGSDQSEKFVYIVNAEGKIERNSVSLGPIAKGLRIVRSGVSPNDLIVTRGLQRVAPGVEVDAAEETIEISETSVLPDDYQPVPKEQWLSVSKKNSKAGEQQ